MPNMSTLAVFIRQRKRAFFFAFLCSSRGNPEFPEFSGISLERAFGVPESRLGEDEVDMLGSGERKALVNLECLSSRCFRSHQEAGKKSWRKLIV